MPKVSVLMPAYNAEKYIREAIDSILAQTFADFEFLIIDDGSADATVDIIESYADPRIRLMRNEHNMGVAATLNRGLDLVQGEYIARMDSDDISLPERFAKQVAYMDTHPQVAVLGTAIELFGAKAERRQFSADSGQLKADTLFGSCFAHPSVMMRAACFGSGRLTYDNAYNKMEDFDLWVRTAEQYQLAALPEVLFRYRIHPNQITQKPTQALRDQQRALKTRQIRALGMEPSGSGFEQYAALCCGEFQTNEANLVELSAFFNDLCIHNDAAKVYDSAILRANLNAVIRGRLNELPGGAAIRLCRNCGVSPVAYGVKRCARGVLTRAREKSALKRRQAMLKNKDFSILSNNCWGSFVYQKYGLEYRSPTAGLYILGHDFVKFCSDWQNYLSLQLEFIPWESASYYEFQKESAPYPVAKLGDIEVYFMHYHSEQEAAEKWYRRAKRINPDKLLFKLSEREGCSKEDIEHFMALPLEHKICFAFDDVPGTIQVPELEGFSGDEFPVVQRYYDELDLLNSL